MTNLVTCYDDQRSLIRGPLEVPPGSGPWASYKLMLLTPEELKKLPDGTELMDIFGFVVKKHANLDMDTRGGCTAYGFLMEIQADD